jgi:diphthamide synthase subunit DPH2
VKKAPTRKQIQVALLTPLLVKALDNLQMEQTSVTLLRTVRALVEIAFDLAVVGGCPRAVMLEQLQRVTRRRLPQLKPGRPVWVQAEGKA